MESYKNITGKWEFNATEKAFIDFCINHNYEIIECKQFISKTKWHFKISDDVIEKWETYNDNIKFDKKPLEKSISLRIEIEKLQKQLS